MNPAEVPVVVCVTPDATVRERLARSLAGCGDVRMVADLGELRALFCPSAQDDARPVRPPGTDLVIDPAQHRVTWRGGSLTLTRLESEVLEVLASPPLTVWSYERLYTAAWGGAYLGDASTVQAAVKRLRRKLRALADCAVVETVRGVGYRLAIADAAAVVVVRSPRPRRPVATAEARSVNA